MPRGAWENNVKESEYRAKGGVHNVNIGLYEFNHRENSVKVGAHDDIKAENSLKEGVYVFGVREKSVKVGGWPAKTGGYD